MPENKGGKKFDTGKPKIGLIPRRAIEEEAKVLMFGEGKYTRDNWRKGIARTRIVDAILRHAFAYSEGETLDPETGLSHLAHIRCEAAFGLEFEVTHPELDDRYKGK